jgi:hypothetical protein
MSIKRALATTVAAGLGVAAMLPAGSLAQAGMTSDSGSAAGPTINTPLMVMPAGHLTIVGAGEMEQVHLNAVGLTPGSAHEVDLVRGGCATRMRMDHMRGVKSMGTITADSGGAVDTTIGAPSPAIRMHRSLLILLGNSSMGPDSSMVVACASVHGQGHTVTLHSVSQTGMPTTGQAQLSYDAAAQTVTVHVQASGFTPGSTHAAHIHQGSCRAQGAVLYMLQDLTANGHGVIDATRMVTGVTTAPPVSGWYLNIHMGNSKTILANGQPTLQFQPRLCGDIAGMAGSSTGSTVTGTHGQATTSDGEHFLSAGQTGQTIMTVGPFTFTADCTVVQSDGQTYNQVAFNVVSSQDGSDLDGGGPVPAGQAVTIHTDSDLAPNPQGATPPTSPLAHGAFDQTPSASTSTEIAPDGTEVDVFYNDGVNLGGHACFAGAVGFSS